MAVGLAVRLAVGVTVGLAERLAVGLAVRLPVGLAVRIVTKPQKYSKNKLGTHMFFIFSGVFKLFSNYA